MKHLIGNTNILFITLDTLRFDAAQQAWHEGRLATLQPYLGPGGWEKRHTPGSFTYADGGGTPSFLSERQLERLFSRLSRTWPVRWSNIPASFEVSPGTISREKLALLKGLGVDRISLGVQSFVAEDLISLKRPQPAGELERACQFIKAGGFPVFNIDLIYGNDGQDAKRWQSSLNRALEWQPEELYLYPLYIGRLTKLDRSGKRPAEHRRELYCQGMDYLPPVADCPPPLCGALPGTRRGRDPLQRGSGRIARTF